MSKGNSMLGSVLRKFFSLHLFRWSLTPFKFFALVTVVFSSTAWGNINAVTKSFTPASITAGTTSTVTISITNKAPGNPSSISFTDSYPAGLTNATTPVLGGNCAPGTATGVVGGATLSLSGGAISGNKTCTITVSVTACAAGSYTNPSFIVSSSTNSFNSNAVTLTVTAGAVIAANSTVVASPTSIAADGTTTSTITVTLMDVCGNPVSGKTVTLTAGSGSSIITTVSGSTNASGQATFTVKDAIAETVTYTATDTTDSVIITQTASVTFTPVVSSFNVVEPGANATTGKIFTKIAGNNFVLDIVALDALNAISSSFTGVVAVEVVDNTTGAGVCASMTTIAVLSDQVFVAGDAGRHALSSPNTVVNVWRNARVRIKYPASAPTVISCSGDNFAIRPNSLSISVTDADWQTAGTTNTLDNTAASGGVVHKAGRPFTLQATALNAAAATTANYAGTPTALLSVCAGTACTAAFGTFSLGTGTAVTGVINSATATYSEVGAFALQLQDKTFADVDIGDGSTADCVGRYVCSTSVNVGRFVPDHFDTAIIAGGGVPMSCPSGLTCPALDSTVPAVTGMVYAGQSFTTQVTARNAAGLTTFNYNTTTGLSKDVSLSAWDALGSTTTQDPGPGTLANPSIAAASFVNGAASISTTSYSFTVTPTVPTAIYLRALDVDNVSSLRSTPSSSAEGGVEVVHGRIKISNAYGSELLPLSVVASAQYYGAGGWLSNVADTVTQLTFPATFAVGTGTTAVSLLPVSGVLSGGVLTVKLGKPSSGAGIATITPTVVPSYLPVISGTATFGIYKGNNNFIYQRENY